MEQVKEVARAWQRWQDLLLFKITSLTSLLGIGILIMFGKGSNNIWVRWWIRKQREHDSAEYRSIESVSGNGLLGTSWIVIGKEKLLREVFKSSLSLSFIHLVYLLLCLMELISVKLMTAYFLSQSLYVSFKIGITWSV